MNQIRNGVVVLAIALGLAACGKSPAERAAAEGQPAPAAENPAAEPAPAAANPVAEKYEGKIVPRPASDGGKEDGWFFVEQGKRRWISNGAWLAEHGRSPAEVIEIPAAELAQIPEDPNPLGQ